MKNLEKIGHWQNNGSPIVNYRDDTPFGKKVLTRALDKMAVADAVALRVLELHGEFTLFLMDGSSLLYVWCALRHRLRQLKRRLKLVTNNTAVLMELAVDPRAKQVCEDVTLLPGAFDPSYSGAFPRALIRGEETYFRKQVGRCEMCLLAVSELTSECGPAASHEDQKLVKRIVLEEANRVHIVADWEKLCYSKDNVSHALQHNLNRWEEWLNGTRGELQITTTRPSEVTVHVSQRDTTSHPTRAECRGTQPVSDAIKLRWYEWHSRQLYCRLKDRFTELQGVPDPDTGNDLE